MRVLLHACCGPCSIEPMRIFSEEGIDYQIYYANSNIHPKDEYSRRLATLEAYASAQDVVVHEGRYDPLTWEREVAPFGADRVSRCRACYRLRFEETARAAVALGFDAVSTTLTISPYQFTSIINEELERATSLQGLVALPRDFSDRYAEATRLSRALGMYRQNYCGCRISIGEAQDEREARRAARKREKEARRCRAASENSADADSSPSV
jgi:epoxyqueuosine reductase